MKKLFLIKKNILILFIIGLLLLTPIKVSAENNIIEPEENKIKKVVIITMASISLVGFFSVAIFGEKDD